MKKIFLLALCLMAVCATSVAQTPDGEESAKKTAIKEATIATGISVATNETANSNDKEGVVAVETSQRSDNIAESPDNTTSISEEKNYSLSDTYKKINEKNQLLIQSLNNKVDSLTLANSKLKEELEKAKNKHKKSVELEDSVAKLTAEGEELRKQVDSLSNGINVLDGQHSRMLTEMLACDSIYLSIDYKSMELSSLEAMQNKYANLAADSLENVEQFRVKVAKAIEVKTTVDKANEFICNDFDGDWDNLINICSNLRDYLKAPDSYYLTQNQIVQLIQLTKDTFNYLADMQDFVLIVERIISDRKGSNGKLQPDDLIRNDIATTLNNSENKDIIYYLMQSPFWSKMYVSFISEFIIKPSKKTTVEKSLPKYKGRDEEKKQQLDKIKDDVKPYLVESNASN